MANKYDNASISALKGADRVRLRPSVIFGSDDLRGAEQAFFEILSNSIDEAREGYGSIIKVTRDKNYAITVEDEGRGIPLDYNPNEKRYNWELVFCELYAGGKYKTNLGQNYEYSLGLNGLGACATQYASRYFDVEVTRDGFKYELHFERGQNIGGLKKAACSERKTGTKQTFLLDDEVLTDIIIPSSFFREVLKQQAVINRNIKFTYTDLIDDIKETYEYPDGILGYLHELDSPMGFTEPYVFKAEGSGRDKSDRPEYKVRFEMAFCFNNEVNLINYFHNSSFLEYGGAPDKAVRSALVSIIDEWLKKEDKYKGNESKITFNDISDSLILILSSFSTLTSYENQTKRSINNAFIQKFMTDTIRRELNVWCMEHRSEALRAFDQILVNKRSREKAEKMRVSVKKNLMSNLDIASKVRLFVDCRTQNTDRRELYIVEGNSALGSVKMARDAEFQAVIPLRGKILNCLKADMHTIINSEIIMDLVKILGCGIDSRGKQLKGIAPFDLNNLRFSKIIICTDADVDGYQIRTLILAMLYRLTPKLIENHKVFIAESPLFEITHVVGKQEETYFAYTDKEKNDLTGRLTDGKLHIQRSKGLGENEPEMMWQTTMNPKTRRLIEVLPEDDIKMRDTFELLLGSSVVERREHIEQNGHIYMDMLDIN